MEEVVRFPFPHIGFHVYPEHVLTIADVIDDVLLLKKESVVVSSDSPALPRPPASSSRAGAGQDRAGEQQADERTSLEQQAVVDSAVFQVFSTFSGAAFPERSTARLLEPPARSGFSGGQQRRLAFMRALLARPTLFFADEPGSGLDDDVKWTIYQNLARYLIRRREEGDPMTVVCAEHGAIAGPAMAAVLEEELPVDVIRFVERSCGEGGAKFSVRKERVVGRGVDRASYDRVSGPGQE